MLRLNYHDAGWLTPYALHACYAGLAASLSADDPLWLVIARADRGHIALGASQYADAELDLGYCRMRGIPVVQRALGGGTVWVDRDQLCVFFLWPRHAAPRTHADLFDECLALLAAAFAQIGLQTMRIGGQDLWCGGRKLLGSGAATIGHTMVFGASLLERFAADSFAACVHSPSQGFSEWLRDALAAGMTDLSSLGQAESTPALVDALRASCAARWDVDASSPDKLQRAAMFEAECELREPLELGGRRLVRGGIKINRETYLLEDAAAPWLRLLWQSGRLRRAACADPEADLLLQDCLDMPWDGSLLFDRAASHDLAESAVRTLAQRIDALCATLPSAA
ncbi:hypothetical protein BJI67_04910 [Acidihalobacter aeolianus]|uniref:BPL/LPL catalytic domain-containing protein n=1 Tax=Acidihalobacter aeolianus TaxID=2792603 RepID=A0A1D8K6A8_9GAMM|nr:hypothetical protein [Acidihalobacter aeolianus]AOV16499.1 hypothetical protein BJI67_04910 [Acidihalobacter aeolianus]